MVESSKMAAMGAKKSKGSKSKRVTLKQKYKMIKKVRQTTFQKKSTVTLAVVCAVVDAHVWCAWLDFYY